MAGPAPRSDSAIVRTKLVVLKSDVRVTPFFIVTRRNHTAPSMGDIIPTSHMQLQHSLAY